MVWFKKHFNGNFSLEYCAEGAFEDKDEHVDEEDPVHCDLHCWELVLAKFRILGEGSYLCWHRILEHTLDIFVSRPVYTAQP